MHRILIATVLGLCALPQVEAQVGRVHRLLTEKHATTYFDIRYRKNSRAGASVDRAAVMLERDLADICKHLRFDVKKARFVIYLFDNTAELADITQVGGNAGFSTGHQMFIPYDNDQTRYHELVHLVAFRLPKSGSEPRNMFFADGLANALLTFVHGVHVHAVAAVELRHGKMPKLTEMTQAKDFYAWLGRHPGFNAYDVAASYLRFLIDTEGIERVKRYYTGTLAKKVFGKSEVRLEKSWHAALRKFPLRPSVVTLLCKRRGNAVQFSSLAIAVDKRLPKDVLGKPDEWRALQPAAAMLEKKRLWSDADGSGDLKGRATTADWNILPLDHAAVTDCALRAKVEIPANTVGVQLQLGDRCQAMLTNAGVFFWNQGVRHQERSERIGARKQLDFVMVRREGVVTVYLDGFKVLEGDVGKHAGVPAIGVAGGSATFSQVRLRKLGPR